MTEETESKRKPLIARILTAFGLPALAFAISVWIATGNGPASLVTGMAVSGAIAGLYALDRKLFHPRLEKLSRDWLHLGLEMTFLVLEHVLGALAALLACGRLFGFHLSASSDHGVGGPARQGQQHRQHAQWGTEKATFPGMCAGAQAESAVPGRANGGCRPTASRGLLGTFPRS